ncbi:MAG: tetratricopeptide repeat protein [Bacteroidales bacterium]|nr:tetratricopeptide repeat protein [Bacteroidales bacterium]
MKRLLILNLFILNSLLAFAQTQQGFVKTKGRMADGQLVPGQGLKGATVSVKGHTTVLVNADDGAFSFPTSQKQFRLDSVRKKGYQLVDMDACPRTYNYSGNPLYIVMETPEQQLQDQLAAERKIRRTLTKQLQQREDEIESLKALNKISQEEYQQALQKLYEDIDLNEKLVKDMVERYSKIDYDQLNEFDLRISEFILNGELTKADSLLQTKGDINLRLSQLRNLQQANENEEKELRQRHQQLELSKSLASMERNDLAKDCFRKYEIFKMQHQNDSAAYYIELRANLDTTRLDWQQEAGQFIEEYLANYNEAIPYFERMLRQAKTKYVTNDTVAKAYDLIGITQFELGQYDNAIKSFQKALEIAEKDPSLQNYAATLYSNIGVIFSNLGEPAKNLEYQNKSLEIRKRIFEPDDIEIGKVMINIGIAHYNMGDYIQALECYQNTMAIWQKKYPEDHPHIATLYSEMGNLHSKLGDYDKSMENHRKALEIRKKLYGEEHPDIASCYANQGNVLSQLGEDDSAMEYYQKALSIWTKTNGENNFKIATVYNNMGNTMLNKNDLIGADSCFMKSINIRSKLLGENHPDLASAYNGIGMLYYYQGNPAKALEYFERALNITRNAFGATHPYVASAYHNMGYIHFSIGDYDKAMELLNKALEIRKKIFETDNPDIASNYNIMGHVFAAQGDYKQALEYYRKALKIREEALGAEHNDTKSTKVKIIEMQEKIKDSEK